MEMIIRLFATIALMVFFFFTMISLIFVSENRIQAEEFKSTVVNEIENSDFNQNVIHACQEQAKQKGYDLSINECTYDEWNNIVMADVNLDYKLNIPIFGINLDRTLRSVAR